MQNRIIDCWKFEYLKDLKTGFNGYIAFDKFAVIEKLSTWSDFIHCTQSCTFAWILGCCACLCLPVNDFHLSVILLSFIIAFNLLTTEALVDWHRYSYIRKIFTNSDNNQIIQ